MSAGARDGGTAIDQLLRLLHLIPAATREGGVSYREMAERLGVDAGTIERDVRVLIDRSAYLEAGDAGLLQAELDGERVVIWSPGPFERPPRLRRDEAVALVLGVRSLALLHGDPPDDMSRRLLDRLEGALGAEAVPDPDRLPIEDASADASGARIRDRALDAAAACRVVELLYLKPGSAAPVRRRLEPSLVVHAEGRWYLVGHAPREADDPVEADDPDEAVRAFRLDRVLELEETGETFAPRPAPALDRQGRDARVYFPPDDARRVSVLYSPKIVRWIRERHEGELLPDGSYRVVHDVADPEWLVRHVAQYAGEARAEGEGAEWVREALGGGAKGA